jgi:hypothetical protein
MFSNRVACTPAERSHLKAYLLPSPVRWLCPIIDAGASVEKADVQSLAEIGSLETIFECLGGIKCQDLHETKRFRVDQVLAALQHPSCTDKAMLASVTRYKDLYQQGKLDILITLFDCADGLIVCDGNKRMVACHEHTKKQRISSLVLPVFIVSAPKP